MGMELERGLELSWCTQQVFYSCKKQTKIEEDMGMELERGLELFFQKNWSKLLLLISFFFCVFWVSPLLPMLKEHL